MLLSTTHYLYPHLEFQHLLLELKKCEQFFISETATLQQLALSQELRIMN